MAQPLGDIMAKGTPSMGKRQKTTHIVAVVVEETHITSKNPFVHPGIRCNSRMRSFGWSKKTHRP